MNENRDGPDPPPTVTPAPGSTFALYDRIDEIRFVSGRRVAIVVAGHLPNDLPGLRLESLSVDGRRFALVVPPEEASRFGAAVAAGVRKVEDELERRRSRDPRRVAPLSPAFRKPGVPRGRTSP